MRSTFSFIDKTSEPRHEEDVEFLLQQHMCDSRRVRESSRPALPRSSSQVRFFAFQTEPRPTLSLSVCVTPLLLLWLYLVCWHRVNDPQRKQTIQDIVGCLGNEQCKKRREYSFLLLKRTLAESKRNLDAISKHLFKPALTRVDTLHCFLAQCI